LLFSLLIDFEDDDQFQSHPFAFILLALKICNGDINQAEIMLNSDPLELGAFNQMNDMQKEAIQFFFIAFN